MGWYLAPRPELFEVFLFGTCLWVFQASDSRSKNCERQRAELSLGSFASRRLQPVQKNVGVAAGTAATSLVRARYRFRAGLRLFLDTFGELEHCRLVLSRPYAFERRMPQLSIVGPARYSTSATSTGSVKTAFFRRRLTAGLFVTIDARTLRSSRDISCDQPVPQPPT